MSNREIFDTPESVVKGKKIVEDLKRKVLPMMEDSLATMQQKINNRMSGGGFRWYVSGVLFYTEEGEENGYELAVIGFQDERTIPTMIDDIFRQNEVEFSAENLLAFDDFMEREYSLGIEPYLMDQLEKKRGTVNSNLDIGFGEGNLLVKFKKST